MPSGNGKLPIDPWKPATAAVVEFLSVRDFMGDLCITRYWRISSDFSQ
jgi:hypothetical protein